jgi:hypothetical protein
VRSGVADVPRFVTTAIRLAARERTLRLLMLIALGTGPVLVSRALVFSLCNGASGPLCKHLLHARVDATHRATMVSASSLALQLGGILSSVQPRIYETHGPAWAFGLAALVLLGLGTLSLPLTDPPSGDEEPLLDEAFHDGQHLLGSLGLGQPGAARQDGEQVTEPSGPVAPGEQRRAVRVDPT